jgi:hypothetical protein
MEGPHGIVQRRGYKLTAIHRFKDTIWYFFVKFIDGPVAVCVVGALKRCDWTRSNAKCSTNCCEHSCKDEALAILDLVLSLQGGIKVLQQRQSPCPMARLEAWLLL